MELVSLFPHIMFWGAATRHHIPAWTSLICSLPEEEDSQYLSALEQLMKHAALGSFLTKGYWDFCCDFSNAHSALSWPSFPTTRGVSSQTPAGSGRGAVLHFTVSLSKALSCVNFCILFTQSFLSPCPIAMCCPAEKHSWPNSSAIS